MPQFSVRHSLFKRVICVAAAVLLLSAGASFAAAQQSAAGQMAKGGALDSSAQLVAEWTRAKTGIQEYIDAMPDDGIGFKPTPQVRSFAEQMLHVAGANYMFASAAANRENPYDMAKGKIPEKMEELKASKAALKQFVLGSYDFVIEAVKSLKPDQLNGEVEFFKMKMPRHVLLAKALEHHAHHRGQTTVYLRLKGVTPPSERLF